MQIVIVQAIFNCLIFPTDAESASKSKDPSVTLKIILGVALPVVFILMGVAVYWRYLYLLVLTVFSWAESFTAVISHTRPPTIFTHFKNYVLVDVNQMYP